eukprot:TRINITY_DN7938_c0_g2_i1.p1 TRINITY_DN7938_c0_g2~~TRINITY_DN7938_c0_g2_i1.p1  ORF type:complete len:340 (-),score=19.39 TRINITY_DN7938_c0_g2_i1:39-995(-)
MPYIDSELHTIIQFTSKSFRRNCHHASPTSFPIIEYVVDQGYRSCLQYAHNNLISPYVWRRLIEQASNYYIHNDCDEDDFESDYYEYKRRAGTQILCDIAAIKGLVSCLQYLCEHGCIWDNGTMRRAARHGHLDIMIYLMHNQDQRKKDETLSEIVCVSAIKGDHMDCLQYAHQNGYPWGTGTTIVAARWGRISCLQYARTNGYEWNSKYIVHYAAEYGQLSSLKYAYENGCGHWDVSATHEAAHGGHLACLQYLHETVGCPWDFKTVFWAINGGKLECLKYVCENGCDFTSKDHRIGNDPKYREIREYLIMKGANVI